MVPDPHDPEETLVGSAADVPVHHGAAPAQGEQIGPYQVVREIGRGGQAVVYLAEDTRLHRQVALKVLAEAHDERTMMRFHREAEITSRLEHPRICSVYELGEDRGMVYIAMQFIGGEVLAKRISRSRGETPTARTPVVALPGRADGDTSTASTMAELSAKEHVRRVVRMGEQIARALYTAHDHGIVHRDVKPANVMITDEGDPVILDFGLARNVDDDAAALTKTGHVIGTPAYMSPEQLTESTATVDHRTDIYSLGATLYECLTLHRPFEAPTYEALYRLILTDVPTDPRQLNPAIPKPLRVVLETALEKDRARRYKSALDLAEDLRRVRQQEPIHARPAGPVLRARRWVRRHPVPAVILGVLTLLLATVSYFLQEKDILLGVNEQSLRRARAAGLANASGDALLKDPMLALLLAIEGVDVRRNQHTLSAVREALGSLHELQQLQHDESIQWARFGPDGETVLSRVASGEHFSWDVASGERSSGEEPPGAASADAEPRLEHPDHEVHQTVGDPGGRYFATIGCAPGEKVPNRVWLWDRDGQVLVQVGHEEEVLSVAFAPEGDRIVTASQDFTARVWSTADGTLEAICPGHSSYVASAVFSPQGDRVLTASSDQTARLFDLSGREIAALRGHKNKVTGAVFSPDGTRALTWSDDESVRVWDVTFSDPLVIRDVGDPGAFYAACFAPSGKHILTANRNGKAQIWGLDGVVLHALEGHSSYVASAAYSRAGDRIVTTSADHTAILWSYDDSAGPRKMTRLSGHDHYVLSAAISPSDGRVVTVSVDGTAVLWSPEGARLASLVHGDGRQIVRHTVFSRTGRLLATAGADGVARVWDMAGAEPVLLLELEHPGPVRTVDISFLEDWVLTACEDKNIYVWSVEAGEVEHVFRGHVAPVNSATFSHDAKMIVSACRNGTIRLWDVEARRVLEVIEGHAGGVWSAQFSLWADRFVSASQDQTARVWIADPEKLIERARQRVRRDFTVAEREEYQDLLVSSTESDDG